MVALLDPENREPLYRQISDFFAGQIQSGTLPARSRLPASRALAATLGVNRNTVTDAYGELAARGLVLSRIGSGVFVATSQPMPHSSRLRAGTGSDWPLWQQELSSCQWMSAQREYERYNEAAGRPEVISFTSSGPPSNLFPTDDFRRVLQSAIRRGDSEIFSYGEWSGRLPLRVAIAGILTERGIAAGADQILVTSGSQQGLALVAHLLLSPGDTVLVEKPTFTGAIDLFRLMQLRMVEVPVDEDGMQVDGVEDILRRMHPRLIYTVPTFQNPTGVCMSDKRRRDLVALATRYGVPILEDDFAADLRYDGPLQPTLKSLDPFGSVIYLGTFSKVLMRGLRVGFLVADGPVFDRLVTSRRLSDLGTGVMLQRAMEVFIAEGRYKTHLRRVRSIYRKRRDAMVAALELHMPDGTRWVPAKGGLYMWIKLPDELPVEELTPVAMAEGVGFVPGVIFFPGERLHGYVRVNYAAHPEDTIQEGVGRLGRAIRRCLAQRRVARV